MSRLSITLIPRGGLANRMRAIASAVALVSDINANLTVVWIKTPDLSALFSDIFISDNLPFQLLELSHRHFSYLPHRLKYLYLPTICQDFKYRATLRDEMHTDRYYLIDADAETIRAYFTAIGSGNILVDTCHEFYPYSAEFYRSLYQPSHQVVKRIKELYPTSGCRPIGLHIRRTDHIQAIKHSPISLFEDAIRHELSLNHQRIFYLASDDSETKNYLLRRFQENISTSPSPASRSSLNGMIDGAAEMFVLSKCESIIGSFNSSYSEAAALLGEIPLQIIKI